MDTQTKEELEKRLKDGWIKTVMMLEVMAVTEEATTDALDKHIENLRKEKKTYLYKKDFQDMRTIENPFPKIERAYSKVVSVELVAQDFDTLVYLVMNYGPSSVEILEPEKIVLDMGEAQGVLASISGLIHKFAQQGLGGIIIRS